MADSLNNGDTCEVNTRSLMQKVHWRVLPCCLTVLFFANIDKGNLGFVANQLCRDLNLTHTEYGTGVSAFFMGCLISRIPSNIALRYFGGPFWLMIIVFTWGVTAASMAAMNSVYQFYILRLLLGLAEGGAFPGVWFYLTGFFPDNFLTIPYTVLSLASPIAAAVAGPIAAAFVSIDGYFGLAAWRSLFLFEGIVPAVFAPALYFTIPKNINDANFLTAPEQTWLKQQLKDNKTIVDGFLSEAKTVLQNRSFWILSLSGILRRCLDMTILFWTTLMIEQMYANPTERETETCASSHSIGMRSILITAVLTGLSAVMTLLVGMITKKSTNRSPIAAWICASSGVSLWFSTRVYTLTKMASLVFLAIAVCTSNATHALEVGLMVSHFDQLTKSTALSLFATLATLGALSGPILTGVIVDAYGNYEVASLVLGCLGTIGGLVFLVVKDPLNHHPIKRRYM